MIYVVLSTVSVGVLVSYAGKSINKLDEVVIYTASLTAIGCLYVLLLYWFNLIAIA